MVVCKRCVSPTTALNTILDNSGVCNLCHTYDEHHEELFDHRRMQALFNQRLERVRGHFSYDALVGLSGGKDSSYVAYRLVKEYGLRILLFTYDNGYLSESAKFNIRAMVKKLGQDHVFLSPDPALQSAIARASMRRVGVPCIGCTFPGFLAAIKVATERGVPYILHGRSPAQMFKELAPGAMDPFLPFLQGNFLPLDVEANRHFIINTSRKMSRNFRRFVSSEVLADRSLVRQAARLYFTDQKKLKNSVFPPEFLAFFLFEPYDEDLIKDTLERDLGWKRPSEDRFMGHEDCVVHAAAVYLYTKNYGHPILQPELATLVRQGKLSRRQALERLEQEVETKICPEESLARLTGVTGMSRSDLIACAEGSSIRLAIFRRLLQLRQKIWGRWLKSPLPFK